MAEHDKPKAKIETTQITFRLPISVQDKLDDICDAYRIKRSDFFIECINSHYDKLNGSPELLKMLEQYRALEEAMRGFAGKKE